MLIIHYLYDLFSIQYLSYETLPKVSVIHRNATSITITFEDFKPINDDGYGYEIHYQPNSGFWHLYNQWLIVKSNGQPFYTIAGLKPNTRYKIQVFTWSELDHKQVLHSEIIEATTANGCIFQNRSYELQEKILDDCEQTCHCIKTHRQKPFPKKNNPYRKA
ncbi:hypothetical protein QR98_0029100 [Sarcoptes scabiei]|uniref:Uncharacterized protein n=1 Tax=Sarcoptes scabiei TaxID=52283 RepID=A0A132A008_SARSC|nr:hypothetical protein QR98_0029100 [Sarcoptes scabiei]